MVSKKVLPIALFVSLGMFVQQASARDFLEELFGLGGSEPSGQSNGGAGQVGERGAGAGPSTGVEPAKKRVAAGGTFCVRSCDGYFFPMPGVGKASQQSMCEMACPSAAVDVYRGGSIETSRNARGQSYAALPNAFSFRAKVTEKCSCNAAESSQAHALKSLRQDPTLRNGDIVFDNAGASVYRGASFASAESSSVVPASARKTIRAVLALPRVAPAGESVVEIARTTEKASAVAVGPASSKQGVAAGQPAGDIAQKSASAVAVVGPSEAARAGGKF